MSQRAVNDVNAILRARADALAEVHAAPESAGPGRALLTFRLGRTLYALDPHSVGEVWPVGAVARVPGRTPGLRGIINVRGRLLPLYDLGRVLYLPNRSAVAGSIIVVVHDGEELGLQVDAIEGMRQVLLSDISPIAKAPSTCIEGVLPDGALVFNGAALFEAVTECSSRGSRNKGGMS